MSSPLNGTRIAIIGHPSADLEGIAQSLPENFALSLAHDDQLTYEFAEFAAVVLAISAHEGAPNTLVKAWDEICEFQIPRAIVVTKIDEAEADFDEAVLIARRMFGEGLTPYLVLHADDGNPCALIDLENLLIRDYSSGRLSTHPADEEHKALVHEFREEYLEGVANLEGARFATGLFVPIIPFSAKLQIGPIELSEYLSQIIET